MKQEVFGARLKPACEILNISERTYQRWTRDGSIKEDQRPLVDRPIPKNKLTDDGVYIASESTVYRILKEEEMNTYI